MKRNHILTTAMAASMLAGCITAPLSAAAADPQPAAAILYGDANCDQTVDVADAVLLARFAAEDADVSLTAAGRQCADVNLDNTLDAEDLTAILQYIAKQRTVLGFKKEDEKKETKYNAVNLTETAETVEVKSKVSDDKFIASQLDLTVNLLKESLAFDKYANKNTMISPLSISQALAMTANGAVGQTQNEMTKVLGGDLSMDDLNAYYYWYTSNLKNDDNASLKQANSIWVRDDEKRVQVPDAFLQIAKSNYDAQVFRAPFDDTTVTDINNWVSYHTDEMIPKLLDKIEPEHIMFLINALAFDASWAVPYEEDAVCEEDFRTADGKTVTADFMHSEEGIYISDENAAGFIKSYAGGNYSFAAVLPNEDITLTDYVKNMTGSTVKQLLYSRSGDDVEAAMPKFTFDYDIQLKKPLQNMGMPTAFIYGQADFTKLNAVPGTFIDFVLHKTHIEVDEKGTKAAAATVVGLADECAPETRTVTLDRPFLFMIFDNNTNLPVFIGCVYDPTAQ